MGPQPPPAYGSPAPTCLWVPSPHLLMNLQPLPPPLLMGPQPHLLWRLPSLTRNLIAQLHPIQFDKWALALGLHYKQTCHLLAWILLYSVNRSSFALFLSTAVEPKEYTPSRNGHTSFLKFNAIPWKNTIYKKESKHGWRGGGDG